MSKINEPIFTKAIKSSAFQRSQLAEKATTRVPVSSALRTRISTTFRVFTAITSTKMAGSWRRTWKTIRIRSPEGQFFEGHQCLTFSGSMEALACTPVTCPVIRLHTAAFGYQRRWRSSSSKMRQSALRERFASYSSTSRRPVELETSQVRGSCPKQRMDRPGL